MDINLITPGIYRQRSYENLKNGKSSFLQSPHYRLSRIVNLPSSIPNTCESLSSQQQMSSCIKNHKQIEHLNQLDDMNNVNSIINYDPQSSTNNDTDMDGLTALPSHTLSPASAPLVPIHYKYYTPQRRYKDLALTRYPYHKNRAVPRKQLLEQEKFLRDSERRGYRSSKSNDIRVCLDLESPTDPMQGLLREIDLCDTSENESDPMLRLHHTNYRANKKHLTSIHGNFGRKSNRFSNVYDYSLASIFEDFTSDDSL